MAWRTVANTVLAASLVAVICVGLVPSTLQMMEKATEVTDFTWTCSKGWAMCAETARADGVLLAAGSAGNYLPAAQVSLADDIGHNLLLGVRAMILDQPVLPADCAQLNVVVTALGYMLVTLVLLASRFRVAALVFCVLLAVLAVPSFSGTSPHASHPGIAMFATVFCATAAAHAWSPKTKSVREAIARPIAQPASVAWMAVGFLFGALAAIIRSAIVLPIAAAMVATLGCIAWARAREGASRSLNAVSSAVVVGILVAGVGSAGWSLLRARDLVWDVPPAELVESHGLSHNLVIGIGVVENSLGVKWSDTCGWELARTVDPSVGYVTPAYYRCLWRVYGRLWLEHPREMARVYWEKSLGMLQQRAFGMIPMWAVLLTSAGMAITAMLPGMIRSSPTMPHFLLIVPACSLIGMYVLQGAVVHPDRQYWQPVEALALLCAAVTADMTACRLSNSVGAPGVSSGVPLQSTRFADSIAFLTVLGCSIVLAAKFL